MKIIRKYFWFVPSALWMYLIYGFSDQVGEVSGGLSLTVTEKLAEIVHRLCGERVAGMDLVELMHPYVRKAAHMGEYAVLFVLLFLSFVAMMRATRAMSVSIFVSFIYACADEYHQTMIAGRAGQWTDVCVDMTGVLAAVMVLLFIYAGWQGYDERRRERKMRGRGNSD